MSKAAQQLYRYTEEQLMKLAGQGVAWAQQASEQSLAIRKAQGRPVCFRSEFNGFQVLDDGSQDAIVMQRILSMEQRSKPFPG